ncbi:four-carbon acid sugar kinase family protein [Opitutus sp. ER46]|uniref:four-carbon acid sugar kinase family protein n=1 Tax=Opitutus sp. ER46 TaxID=2161864 RepID=UPI000D3241AC|nr:four-carbon acid sugar kinase family protein [Opitutus sp. ER46]PTX91366.1 hypothetical protein DB354_15835 [Opitutus sp. ER46]
MPDFFLADDLSGALDAGAAFLRVGRRVRIVLRPGAWERRTPEEVLGITTETRNASPTAAASVVRATLGIAAARGEKLVYKKIDSTLRGPVAAEIEAVKAMMPLVRVLFAPANPRVGRTVQNGRLLVKGVPVAETDFGRDPASPLRASAVREILGRAADVDVAIPDTLQESDLAEAVRRMDADGAPWLPVGSGALAVPVAARLADRGAPTPAPTWPPVPASPVLMLGGSAHPLNQEQAAALEREYGVARLTLSLEQPAQAILGAADQLRRVGGAILHGPAARISPAAALRAVVDASVALIDGGGVRRIFATGGETAHALCERLDIRSLELCEEIEPGLCLSVGESPRGAYLLAVKPGGFGDTQTWIRAFERLKE